MALSMQKRCLVFKEVYLVNHLRDILDYSCKWLVFKYSYAKAPKLPLVSLLLFIWIVQMHLY